MGSNRLVGVMEDDDVHACLEFEGNLAWLHAAVWPHVGILQFTPRHLGVDKSSSSHVLHPQRHQPPQIPLIRGMQTCEARSSSAWW